jgi:GNAT superfamily N-acetyltransferase
VQAVVDEVYGRLWAPPPIPIDEDGWDLSWIAVLDAKIVGVVATNGEWLDDLWVLLGNRGCGVGQRLLAKGEAEIIARGHDTLRLRVAQSNEAAIAFYRRRGWQIVRAFPHEKYPVTMLGMSKVAGQEER